MVMMVFVTMMFMFMVFIFMMFIFVILDWRFHFANPGCGGGCTVEIKNSRVYDFVEVNVAVVTFYDFGSRLYGTDDSFDTAAFESTHL